MIRPKKWSWWIAPIGFVVFTGLAFAQTKRDFEKAAQETGCDLIPYSSSSSQCHYSYGKQREWCTGERGRGCGELTKDQKDEVQKRRDNAVECVKYRKEVKKEFDDALDKLSREKDEDLKSFVDEIIRRITAGQPGHAQAIEDTERRRDKCGALL